jgi:TolA-binding protein
MKNISVGVLLLLLYSASFAQMPIPMQIQGIQLPNTLQMMQQAEQIRAIQLQNEQAALQLRQMEEQRRAQERQRQQQNEERQRQSQSVNQPDPIIDEWLKAAAPRMGLYKDFEKVVFADDVAITIDMIRLMTPSSFAADIAYYLGTNKLESLAISKMSLVEAARSIDRIETQLHKNTPK